MKKTILLLAISTGIFTQWCCSQATETNKNLESTAVKKENTIDEPAYVCPMGKECGYSDKPGKCSGCEMELLPISNKESMNMNLKN